MARHETKSLFGEPDEEAESIGPDAPLAERMRPRTPEEFAGQEHLLGEGRLVRRLIGGRGPLPSLILWGGAGTGPERGLDPLRPQVAEEVLDRLALVAAGDARGALSALAAAVRATEPDADGVRTVGWPTLVEALGRARYAYDKGGEEFYNLIS